MIDPDVDGERDFIAGIFLQARLLTTISNELLEILHGGVAATGESDHLDGKLLLVTVELVTVEGVQSASRQ